MEAKDLASYANQELVTEFSNAKRIPVVEIFGPTIQGEGPLAGTKTMFVRTGGCDYRCEKCDSLHAVMPQAVKAHARRLTQGEILAELLPVMQRTGTKWVTFSGGNPVMWDLGELQQGIQDAEGYTMVETQGTLFRDWVAKANMVTVSPKSRGMGEKFELEAFSGFLNAAKHRTNIALKVVIFSQQDIDFALEMGEIATDMLGAVPRGMRFFSLGNPYPPRLGDDMAMHDRVTREILVDTLLREYRILIEDMTVDPRVSDWKFLPQLHVLAFGNEAGR